MSLINEALRKARKEAAQRDAAERGTTYREPRAHLPRPTPWLPALVGGVALGLLVAAGAFVFLPAYETGRAKPDAAPPPSPPNATVTPEGPTPNPTVTLEATPKLTAAPEQEPRAPNPTVTPELQVVLQATAEPRIVDSVPDPAPNPTVTPEAGAPNPTVTPEAPPEDATPEVRRVQPPDRVGEVGDRVYVLEAEVDGVALRLDFIVWSSSNPFAQINGSQVSVGQTVEGFLVRSIAREEVTLEGDGGAFRLRVR